MKTRIANNFVHDVYYIRSIDGLLIKLGSLISDINKSIYPLNDVTTKQLLRRILLTEKVLKALSPFSDHIHDIRLMIEIDPRHCSLRDYVDEIMEAMNEAKKHRAFKVERTIELIRPPLREIEMSEKAEHEEVRASAPVRLYYKKAGGRKVALKPVAVGITVILVAILAWAILFSDYDSDGLTNYEELWYGANPLSDDTDGDGLSDVDEVRIYGVSPRIPLATKLVFQETTLKLQEDCLVVEHIGCWLPYLWIEIGEERLHLTYFIAENSIVAEYVFVNSSFFMAEYPLRAVLSTSNINGYLGSLIIKAPDVAAKCKIVYLRDRSLMGFEGYEKVSLEVISPFRESLHEALLKYVNKTSLQFLRERLLGGRASWNLAELSWHVLAWLDNNVVYDYSKALLNKLTKIYDPITFYNKKSGICSDYALFTVAALLAGRLPQAYVLIINTSEGEHAAAGVEIDGKLFILDQHLPPYEWADYVEYVFQPIGEAMQVIKVWLDLNGEPAIEAWTVNPMAFTSLKADSYPLDRVSQGLIEETLMKVCRETNTILKPQLNWRLQVTWQIFEWSPLKAYHPIFHSQFVEFLAKVTIRDLGKYFNQARYAWYKIEGISLILYFE